MESFALPQAANRCRSLQSAVYQHMPATIYLSLCQHTTCGIVFWLLCRFVAISYDLKQKKPELSVAWAGDTFPEKVGSTVLHPGWFSPQTNVCICVHVQCVVAEAGGFLQGGACENHMHSRTAIGLSCRQQKQNSADDPVLAAFGQRCAQCVVQ